MAKMIGTFTADILSHAVESCLDLVTVPYRRISFGADYDPFSQIEDSLFEGTLQEIAASLFRRTGINLARLDFGLDSTSDPDSEACQELYKFREFCAKPLVATLSQLNHYEAPIRPRSLLSNEIFGGIIASPRARHLLSAHDSWAGLSTMSWSNLTAN
jgi:hypothetical protein